METYSNPFFGPITAQMRPHAFAEIEIADDFPCRQIDDHHVGAIRAGLSDAGVSVDRNVGEFSVGRCRDFVPGNAALGDFGNLFSGDRIDDAETVGLLYSPPAEAHPVTLLVRLGPR